MLPNYQARSPFVLKHTTSKVKKRNFNILTRIIACTTKEMYSVKLYLFPEPVTYNNGITTTDIEKGADEATALLYNLFKSWFLAYW